MNFKIKTVHGSAYWELPCTEDKIQELCQTLCIENSTATKVTVDSVSLNAPADALFKGKTFNLDKLNYLAKRLDSFSGKETATFYAVAYGQSIDSIDDLINLSFNTHCFGVVRDFSDINSVGKELFLTEEGAASPQVLNQLNGTGYFQSVMESNPHPIVTPYGIIYKNKNEFETVFDGTHFPLYAWESKLGTVSIVKDGFEEYLYLPFACTELSKALERLGAASVSECQVAGTAR